MKTRKTRSHWQFFFGIGGMLFVGMLLNAELLAYRLDWVADLFRTVAGRLQTMQVQ